MKKNIYIYSILSILIVILASLSISWSYATTKYLSGIFGTTHSPGVFLPSGNAGKVFVDGYEINSGTTSDIIVTGRYMFLESVGWVELTQNTTSLPGTNIDMLFDALPSTTVVTDYIPRNNIYGWSDNAGWIDFNSTNISSGITYIGGGFGVNGAGTFSGLAWSDTLGWIDFSGAVINFQNKVKVIGNIGGDKIFDIFYNVGTRFSSASITGLQNTIRKNIALMTRGVDATKINVVPAGLSTVKKLNKDTIIYILSGQTIDTADDLFGPTNTDPLRSIIIVGGNLRIDNDIEKHPQVNTSRAVIVMKNDAGQGGNIYIKDNVKNIYTTLIAEGAMFSGESATSLYNDTNGKRETLPPNQLYIYGSAVSRNTIGGSQKNPLSCPYIVDAVNCTKNEAAIYDWNYFRTYDKNALNRSYKVGYDDSSIIIEYDPRLIQDPPPGLTP